MGKRGASRKSGSKSRGKSKGGGKGAKSVKKGKLKADPGGKAGGKGKKAERSQGRGGKGGKGGGKKAAMAASTACRGFFRARRDPSARFAHRALRVLRGRQSARRSSFLSGFGDVEATGDVPSERDAQLAEALGFVKKGRMDRALQLAATLAQQPTDAGRFLAEQCSHRAAAAYLNSQEAREMAVGLVVAGTTFDIPGRDVKLIRPKQLGAPKLTRKERKKASIARAKGYVPTKEEAPKPAAPVLGQVKKKGKKRIRPGQSKRQGGGTGGTPVPRPAEEAGGRIDGRSVLGFASQRSKEAVGDQSCEAETDRKRPSSPNRVACEGPKPEALVMPFPSDEEVVDFFLQLMQTHLVPSSATMLFSSHFYTRLTAAGAVNGEMGWENVKGWTKKKLLFSHQLAIVPVNSDLHWWLALIFFDRTASSFLSGYLRREWQARSAESKALSLATFGGDGHGLTMAARKSRSEPELLPAGEQDNGVDCGIFLLDNVWRLLSAEGQTNIEWCTPDAAHERRLRLRRLARRLTELGGDVQAQLASRPELSAKLRAVWGSFQPTRPNAATDPWAECFSF
eukprot:g15966.t1